MKKFITIPLLILMIACSNKSYQFENSFVSKTDFPINIDSSFYKSDFSSYKNLSIKDIKTLYNNAIHIDEDMSSYIIKDLFKMDSLKDLKKTKRADKWTLENTKLIGLNKFKLNSGIECFTWYLYYPYDINQFGEFVFLSVKNKEGNFSCTQISKLRDYSDAPLWTEGKTCGKIFKDGKIEVKIKFISGEEEEIIQKRNETKHSFIDQTGKITINKK